jgi:NAD(P)-dependent dehydrogenase (short-subunit alcohol dehydrogenase family)
MAAVEQIEGAGGSAEYLHLELGSLESCVQAAREFEASSRTIDVLIANAGVGAIRGLTDDGFEIHFGVNHLGHFMLTHHLRRCFRPGTRIVVVSSEMHRRSDGIDYDSVRRRTRSVAGWSEYSDSKLANILFARRLAQLQPEWRTYSLHPGVANTNIFGKMAKPLFRDRKPPHEAAKTSVWCATSSEVADQTGLYYSNMAVAEPSAIARDDDLSDELWKRSEIYCGLAPQH